MKIPAGSPVRTETRCRYRTPTGRRCRSQRSGPGSLLCSRHRAMEKNRPVDDLAPDLTARLSDIRASLQSAEGVRNAIAELYILLAQDRVSPRRAAVLAYLSSLLLRTASQQEKETEPKSPIRVIWDVPNREEALANNDTAANITAGPAEAGVTNDQRG